MSEDLLAEFLLEGREQAALAERALEDLRRGPEDAGALEACFRAVHTLKGSTGLFDFAPLGRLLHQAEDLLAQLRSRSADGADLDFLFEVIDQTSRWLDVLARSGELPKDADKTASHLLERSPVSSAAASSSAPLSPQNMAGLAGVAIRYVPRPDAYFVGDDPLGLVAQTPGLAHLHVAPREPWGPLDAYDPYRCNLVIEAQAHAPLEAVAHALRLVADQVTLTELAATPLRGPEPEAALRTLRVDASRLDELATLVDEIIVGKAGLAPLLSAVEGLAGGEAIARRLREHQADQDRLAAGLQAALGRLRLLPLGPLFDRFPRLVRDLARDLGKSIDLETDPDDVAIEKGVLDGLFEPLLHVVRNAVDHGVEGPETRRAAGKDERGRLSLSARFVGERVMIEIGDDGAGLDPDRLRRTAVERGLLLPEDAERLDDAAACDLVFLSGFSTRDVASRVSGRGVGMDAVRDAVVRLGGEVSLKSQRGQGTQVRFSLPLSVKLSKLLIASCGEERYGLDLAGVLEVLRVSSAQVTPLRASFGFVWRDQPTPLMSLAELVGLPGPAPANGGQVIVVRTSAGPIGLLIDGAVDRMEAAIRPPTGLLAAAPAVSGVTRLPDGEVLLVLDPVELVG